ncbi:MAG: hypothetical protein ACN6PV_02015 [Achromobacter sp.]|uniref:hypothetical protein n=1 Tax=Achromobacter sp. TaxID=134375 RepID=UPI003D023F33
MNAPLPKLGVERIQRDALDHIMRTARASSTQTRRLRWIASRAEGALQGHPYIASEHVQPRMVSEAVLQTKNLQLRLANARLRAALVQVAGGATGYSDRDVELARIAQRALDAEREART